MHIILLQSFWNISTNIFAICIVRHTYKIRMMPICESKTNKNVLNLLIHKIFFFFFSETETNVPRPKKMFQPRITHQGLQYQVFFVLTYKFLVNFLSKKYILSSFLSPKCNSDKQCLFLTDKF